MSSKGRPQGRLFSGLLILAIVTMSNPLVNIFDYLPDFIGCFILVHALSYYARRAPYFDEARSDFMKLGILSLARIPTFIIMTRIISQNMREIDLRPLLTLVFATVEIFLAIRAINNLFSALSYLGQRSEAASLISAFNVSVKKTMKVEELRVLSYALVLCKSACSLLPELLLLTNTEAALNPGRLTPSLLYPYAILVAFIVTLVFGAIFTRMASAFIKTICREDKIHDAAEAMIDDIRRDEIKKKIKVNKMQSFLTVMTLSGLFLFDFSSKKLGGADFIPDFLFGIIVLFAFAKASGFIKDLKNVYVSASAFSVISIARYIYEILFLNEFTYEQLPISPAASAKYLPVILISIFELLSFILLTVFCGAALIRFTKNRTGLSKKSENYGSLDAEYHLGMTKKCILWIVLGIALETIKFIITLTRGQIRGLSPLCFVACLIFVTFGYYLFGKIKEEIQNKYL